MKKSILIIVTIISIMMFSTLVSADLENSASISVSLVNQDPDPAVAGDIVEVRVGITNIGGKPANNIMVELDPAYPFELLPGHEAVQKVGTINGYQGIYSDDTKIIKYKIRVDKDATAGEYELKVKTYEEGSSSMITRSLSLDIENKESAEVIYIDQVELIPGKITPLKFTINNVGATPLRDLTFSWENEDDIILPVGSDNTKYIKYIDIGDSAELTFNVIASATADPNLYKIDLSLKYDDSITNEETEINTKAGVYVGGATDFDAAFSGVSSGEYSFAISNIGSVSASSVTVKVPDQQGWRVSGSDSVIIGNLNEGDYTIVSFKLQKTGTGMNSVNTNQKLTRDTSTRQKEIPTQMVEDAPIKLEIVYTDSRGNRNTIEKEVNIDSSNIIGAISGAMGERMGRMKTQQNPLNQILEKGKWILLAVVLLTAFIIVKKKYNKSRLEDQKYSYSKAIKDLLKFNKKSKRK